MNKLSTKIVLVAGKYGGKVRIATFVLTLVLFVIAAGAPTATGSVGG